MKKDKVIFSRGVYNLNKDPNFNYQLNRVVMWNEGDIEDIKKVAGRIYNSETWKQELIKLGDTAISEERIKESIAYYRMSEFFMYDGDPDKKKYYMKASKLFYDYYKEYFEDGTVKKYEVPYEDVKLPVMYAKAVGEKKDTILLHGGNDSYYEEFFFAMLYLAENGFDVYLFEGPGQGGVMRVQGKSFTYQWEKPVSAILDYLKLCDLTIMGASLGGMLAPRAAAFDKRIKRVVAWSIFPNFLDVIMAMIIKRQKLFFNICMKLKAKEIINFIYKVIMSKDEMLKWGVEHGMYAYDAKTPYDYLMKLNKFQMIDVGPKITQDFLVIGASKDHFINCKLFKEEMDALINVHSLTFRLFTEKEDAGNHCNMGNTKLLLDSVINWIEMMIRKEENINR
ncbi:MAG: alpha/beta fold hydrolase [Clostridium sp.]|nr:alpha/beta fold hydrolase [Clostridium sp.]